MKFTRLHLPPRRDLLLVLVLSAATLALALVPSGYSKPFYALSDRVKAEVLQTDNSQVQQFPVVSQGEQEVTVRILEGRFAGQTATGSNFLNAKLDLDKLYLPGDHVLVVVDWNHETGSINAITIQDYWRLDIELILALLFALGLLAFSGWVGLKSVLSFVCSLVVIWKLLIPAFLAGWAPVPCALATVAILSAMINFLVAGINRTGLSAVLGSFIGLLMTWLISLIFTGPFHLNGAIRPFSETLLYSGFAHLDLHQIFLAGVFLAASGAVMDLAMDIASAMTEVSRQNPHLDSRQLFFSGVRVGRSVLGTMTTTLLLAYTGGYTSMLMVFMAQGVPLESMFNMNYMAGEIFHTLVGSFGLVMVAPATAFIGSRLLRRPPKLSATPVDQTRRD